ncbi:MAG: hypothetical protein KGH64_03255 [Candidatus Micrarchaeota archaeon]|nr:hypothetical protein [Candidatus Micrarchaeota archaeon]MDE1834330.1 hypothetical protein [Candidatus Micrarchaeota archaeon]MDE1859195.1 hypothetical protein [Candidatus Micrarchaeota archaeon]
MAKINKRWFDNGDLNAKHDEIALWVSQDPSHALSPAIKHIAGELTGSYIVGSAIKYKEEPCLKGYPDVFPDGILTLTLMSPHNDSDFFQRDFVVEYKAIINYGETLRQINIYRSRTERKWKNIAILVTPDTRFDAAFERNNIVVIHPDYKTKEMAAKEFEEYRKNQFEELQKNPHLDDPSHFICNGCNHVGLDSEKVPPGILPPQRTRYVHAFPFIHGKYCDCKNPLPKSKTSGGDMHV